MNTVIAQTRLKTSDFGFNYTSINNVLKNSNADLIIFPQADISELGGKDMCYDEKCNIEQAEFYNKLAQNNADKTFLLGDILIQKGKIVNSEDGYYNVNDKKLYVSETYREDIDCDLYILSKNRYFAINTCKDFVESIETVHNFIYVNAIGLADENIFAGGSFAKNKNNKVVLQMPLCEEKTETVDFNREIAFYDEEKDSQVLKVTTFALKEYCENTGFKKVILGLSGGIDSALTATLATKALGKDNVLGILMPSMFSSDGSINDSIKLAQNIGIKTEKYAITPLFDNFMEKVDHDTIDTTGEIKENLAVENLQARLRALILMFFSNRDNRLLLSTGNKSEGAMGYGTLYGDLAGGYNLICDLTKSNVYSLSNYINKDEEIIPQEIIDKAPSAELRPGQKDQDSLPDYAILDDIIEMYLEQGKTQDEISQKYDKTLVENTIKKIYRSQFKRKQCCLGVRLTERSFCNGINIPVVQKFY